MLSFFKWQKVFLGALAALTLVSVTYNDIWNVGGPFNTAFLFGYFLDLFIGISSNVLVAGTLLVLSNFVYRTVKRSKS